MQSATPARLAALVACAVAALAAAAYAGWEWYRSRDVTLSQAPLRNASPTAVPDDVSNVGVRVRVPLGVLRDTIDARIPGRFDFGGNGDDACVDLGWLGKHCAGTHYEGTVVKEGLLTLAGDGATLKASVPVRVTGNGGLRGDGARLVDLDAKNFRALVRAKLDASVDLSPEWCPTVDARAFYDWIEPPEVEIVERVWVNIRGQVEPLLDAELSKAPAQIREAIPCAAVQDVIRRVWRAHSFPVAVTDSQTVYVRVDPIRFGFSGVVAAADHVRFSAVLTARTLVGTEPGPIEPKPGLPPLERAVDEPGRVALAVPIRAGYGPLRETLLREVPGKPFRADTPAGPVEALVSDVEIYPAAGGRLAVGVAFRADVPGRWFDVTGRAYVTALPVVEGDELRFADVAFTRVLDNSVWEAASTVFEGAIRQAIERAARLDLAPLSRRAAQAIADATADPARTGGVAFTVSGLSVAAERIFPEADALAVLVRIGATVEASITSVSN